MKKEEAIKLYNDGLERNLNHPLLLSNRQGKDLIKQLCTTAFELGYSCCEINSNLLTEGEKKKMAREWQEKLKQNKYNVR